MCSFQSLNAFCKSLPTYFFLNIDSIFRYVDSNYLYTSVNILVAFSTLSQNIVKKYATIMWVQQVIKNQYIQKNSRLGYRILKHRTLGGITLEYQNR